MIAKYFQFRDEKREKKVFLKWANLFKGLLAGSGKAER